jgi:hypothetical protein
MLGDLITKMHARLNELIERKNFNLLDSEVIEYSQKLDRILILYEKLQKKHVRAAE